MNLEKFDETFEGYDPDWNPWDNDIYFEERAFIRKLLLSEPRGD